MVVVVVLLLLLFSWSGVRGDRDALELLQEQRAEEGEEISLLELQGARFPESFAEVSQCNESHESARKRLQKDVDVKEMLAKCHRRFGCSSVNDLCSRRCQKSVVQMLVDRDMQNFQVKHDLKAPLLCPGQSVKIRKPKSPEDHSFCANAKKSVLKDPVARREFSLCENRCQKGEKDTKGEGGRGLHLHIHFDDDLGGDQDQGHGNCEQSCKKSAVDRLLVRLVSKHVTENEEESFLECGDTSSQPPAPKTPAPAPAPAVDVPEDERPHAPVVKELALRVPSSALDYAACSSAWAWAASNPPSAKSLLRKCYRRRCSSHAVTKNGFRRARCQQKCHIKAKTKLMYHYMAQKAGQGKAVVKCPPQNQLKAITSCWPGSPCFSRLKRKWMLKGMAKARKYLTSAFEKQLERELRRQKRKLLKKRTVNGAKGADAEKFKKEAAFWKKEFDDLMVAVNQLKKSEKLDEKRDSKVTQASKKAQVVEQEGLEIESDATQEMMANDEVAEEDAEEEEEEEEEEENEEDM